MLLNGDNCDSIGINYLNKRRMCDGRNWSIFCRVRYLKYLETALI